MVRINIQIYLKQRIPLIIDERVVFKSSGPFFSYLSTVNFLLILYNAKMLSAYKTVWYILPDPADRSTLGALRVSSQKKYFRSFYPNDPL